MPRLLLQLRPTADARTRIRHSPDNAHELARKMVEHTRALQRRAMAGTRVKMVGSRRSRLHMSLSPRQDGCGSSQTTTTRLGI